MKHMSLNMFGLQEQLVSFAAFWTIFGAHGMIGMGHLIDLRQLRAFGPTPQLLARMVGRGDERSAPLVKDRGIMAAACGVSDCGRLALVGNVRDGDLLLAPKASSSLLILRT